MSVSNQDEPSPIMIDLVDQYSDNPDSFSKTILAQALHLAKNRILLMTDILCSNHLDSVRDRFNELRVEIPSLRGVQSHLDFSPIERLYYIVCYHSDDESIETLCTESAPAELGYLKLVSHSTCNFRHNEETPTVIGIVYLQPKSRECDPRPALKVIYPSDSFVDYIPLSDIGQGFSVAKDVYTLEPSFEAR